MEDYESSHVHAFILTMNEENHIYRCIESLEGLCKSITVVDSGSQDGTVELARMYGASVIFNPWWNYATQANFAIGLLENRGGWLLRIDADEVVDRETIQSFAETIANVSCEVDGILVQRRIHFMGRRIRYGGIEPSWQLRLWRNGRGRCERRWMDEHIKVTGCVAKSSIVISDINLNSLTWWTAKHNNYASREAIDLLNRRHRFMPSDDLSAGASGQARLRRFLKEEVYGRLPSALRALLYVGYRYVVRLGFLDGKPGWYFHWLQGFWYRTLVDAKVEEIEADAAAREVSIVEAISKCTGIDPLGKPQVSALGAEQQASR